MSMKRWLAALLCAALLWTGALAVSEDDIALDVDLEAALDAPVDIPVDDGLFTLDPLLIEDQQEQTDGFEMTLLDGDEEPVGGEEEPGGDPEEPQEPTAAPTLAPETEPTPEPTPAAPVALAVRYEGSKLSKVYDCNKYAAYKKTSTGEIVWLIGEWSQIAKGFKTSLVNPGDTMVPEHEQVKLTLTSLGSFESKDAGEYKLNFTFKLSGDDAGYYTLENPVVSVPAEITPRPVVVTPREGVSKLYGDDDPTYAPGTSLPFKDETIEPLSIGGVPHYGVPINYTDGKPMLTVTGTSYLRTDAKADGKPLFPGWLSRKAGEKVGKYRITQGDMDFGPNYTVKVEKQYFTIKARPIGDEAVTVSNVSDVAYTGKAQKPVPVVRLNGKKLKAGSAYTVTYSNNKNIGKATVTIVGKGNFTGKRKLTFKILPVGTRFTGGKASGQSITVSWKKQSNITGYQIAYGLKKNFTDQKLKTVKGAKKTSLTLKSLQNNRTYYFRIRTYKTVNGTNYYSAWSSRLGAKTP